jgi:hypothetical protein
MFLRNQPLAFALMYICMYVGAVNIVLSRFERTMLQTTQADANLMSQFECLRKRIFLL